MIDERRNQKLDLFEYLKRNAPLEIYAVQKATRSLAFVYNLLGT
jgi:hypothetical protein